MREFLIYTDTTVIIRYATNTYEASNLARDEGYIVLNVQAK